MNLHVITNMTLSWILHSIPLLASYLFLKWSVLNGTIKIEENEKPIHKIIAYGSTLVFSFFICFLFFLGGNSEDDNTEDKDIDHNRMVAVFIILTIGGLIGVYRGRQIMKKKKLLNYGMPHKQKIILTTKEAALFYENNYAIQQYTHYCTCKGTA